MIIKDELLKVVSFVNVFLPLREDRHPYLVLSPWFYLY